VRHGIADACVLVRAASGEERVVTDGEGYFEIFMKVPDGADWRGVWRPVDLRLLEPKFDGVHAQTFVFFPPRSYRFVVISDIDDTVMYTGVANKIKMPWRLSASTAESRLAFPGVGAFYRALHEGVSGTEQNPMLYVSRAPWGIYEVLEDFFNLHKIPIGAVLFLREWGVTLQHPLAKQSKGHKNALIEDMLAVYDDLPFVLIGDIGQRDPEIYSRVVQEHRSRVPAVYIRNVSRDAERIQAIETLATQVAEAGSSLVLAADSQVMASHAADRGLISRDTLQAVREEREQAGEEGELRETLARLETRIGPTTSWSSSDVRCD
jgi:phosphatidate phosphatase APP1